MKTIYLMFALGLSACTVQSTPPVAPKNDIKVSAPGAYMIVQGRGYVAQDLSPYAASLPPIYDKYGGRYVAFSTEYATVEGQSDYQVTIISAWPSSEAAQEFWNSPEYSEAKRLREGVGEFDVIIVPALPTR
ncbi:MAG: DUF1330 domain-containing protein [Hellea sp.]